MSAISNVIDWIPIKHDVEMPLSFAEEVQYGERDFGVSRGESPR